jgi:hypothetical protein
LHLAPCDSLVETSDVWLHCFLTHLRPSSAISKGFWWWYITIGITEFMDFVHHVVFWTEPNILEIRHLLSWGVRKIWPQLLDSGLVIPNAPSWVGAVPRTFSPEDRNRSHFQNVVFCCKYYTISKARSTVILKVTCRLPLLSNWICVKIYPWEVYVIQRQKLTILCLCTSVTDVCEMKHQVIVMK